MVRWVRTATVAGSLWAGLLQAAATPEVGRAEDLYRRTQYQAALKALESAPASDAAAQALVGRSHYMLGDFKKATEAFERAVALEPRNAAHQLWLGRAYGRRAETSSPFTAPGYASKARQSFERSVELDGRNLEAINDLMQYYLEAPGFLGGGMDKAATLARRIQALDPVEYEYAMAEIAQRRKEFQTAEAHLRRAVDLAPRQVGRVVDLAKFLARRGKVQESEAAFAQAEKLAPNSPKVLYERAATYIQTGRNLPQARELLQRYLRAPNRTPEDPSPREAEKLLRQAGG